MRTPSPLSSTTELVHKLSLRALRRWGGLLLCVMVCWVVVPTSASAQGCSNNGFGPFNFGTLQNSGPTDITSSLAYGCWGGSSTTYVQMCLVISAEGTPSAMPAGRRMLGWNSGNQYHTYYDLFSDPARTQKLPTSGRDFSWQFEVPAGASMILTQPIYARAYAPAPGTPVSENGYENSGLAATVRYSWRTGSYPPNCQAGPNNGSFTQSGAKATSQVGNACEISMSSPADLDFGSTSTSTLSAPIDSTTTISLQCPGNLSWRVGLNDGLHAVVAGQRRMAGPSPDFLTYELYRDVSRTQRWGNDTAGGTNTFNGSGSAQTNPTVLTVYGRVPAQTLGAPGTYTDTVTVTLTY